jgi:thiol-disulfide isomerase/thioredoxin
MRAAMTWAVGLAVVVGPSAGGQPAAEKDAVTLEETRAEKLVATIKAQKDKVVVVDFWATWCAPCVKKFPHLVELHKKHAAKGLVCVSVDMARLGGGKYDREQSLGFLKKQSAAFPNFMMTDPEADDKALEAAFGEDFRLLPYLVIFDRGGRRVWDSATAPTAPDTTPAQVEAKVVELLGK